MTQTIEAIYENGVLRPLRPLQLHENARVTVTVEENLPAGPLKDVIGTLSDEDADDMRKSIAEAFEKVNPNEW